MSKITISFKNGNEIKLECDSFTVKTSITTGEITSVAWEGEKNINPLFFRIEDIESIVEELEQNYEVRL